MFETLEHLAHNIGDDHESTKQKYVKYEVTTSCEIFCICNPSTMYLFSVVFYMSQLTLCMLFAIIFHALTL